MKESTRRGFIGTAAMAAGAFAAGCSTTGTACKKKDEIWAALLHMGMNMWFDIRREEWNFDDTRPEITCKCNEDHVRFDEVQWRLITDRMAKVGMNMVIIDLGEAIKYPSHPELWVKGSWEIDRLRKELARLRSMGLEPIPKMNFSTAHDTWLKEYHRMVSTRPYYSVCADLIRDVAEIFDHPRFLHIGFDEETVRHHRLNRICIVRQGDLWWHDFLWFVKETEKAGMRAWAWSDYVWHHPDLFYKRMPKSVLQSNWYYGQKFGGPETNGLINDHVKVYADLDRAGFEQVPTGSNWSNNVNFKGTVDYCRRVCSPDRLMGFMTAPWLPTLPEWEARNLEAIDQVGAVISQNQEDAE